MRPFLFALAAVAVGVLPAQAQFDTALVPDPDAEEAFRVGIGVRLDNFYSAVGELALLQDEEFSGSAPRLYGSTFTVPIDIRALRLEPELGYGRYSDERSSPIGRDGEDGEVRQDVTYSERALGLAAFYRLRSGDATALLFGARVRHSLLRVRLEVDYPDDPNDSPFGFEDFAFEQTVGLLAAGPTIGGEFSIARRFAIGADLSLLYQRYSEDQEDSSDDDVDDDMEIDVDRSLINTETAVYVRFFF